MPTPDIAHQAGPATTRPLTIVSNRLPVSIEVTDDTWTSRQSSGGLVSAVGGLRNDAELNWIGWPGRVIPDSCRADVDAQLTSDHLIPVHLSEAEEAGYYRDYCNDVVWPLFHYFTDKVRHETGAWATYQEVNRKFADTIIANCQPGSRVWIHDFHLMLVPAMLRRERPDLEIGFFLHIPWPSSEIFRLLPNREEILRSMLGADYIGFHTNDFAQHFRSACLRVLGLDSDPDGISYENRRIGIGRHPIGIDTQNFHDIAEQPETLRSIQNLRRLYQGRRVLLGVERLDYSKGILLKLRAFERFLEQDPKRAESVTLLQVIVPSRLDSVEYQELKADIEACVSRINGRFGGPGQTPVEYLHRNISPQNLVALYQFADVGLVTPVRDGMNLVAQEFVLCQAKGAGILILSEFAGAAQVLGESILVNPWHVEDTAQAIATALDMSPHERQRRMLPMVQRVKQLDCKVWANRFLSDLEDTAKRSRALRETVMVTENEVQDITRRFADAAHRTILVDYDGTLREITPTPEMACPTPEIHDILRDLADRPNTDVHIVSGRPRVTLEDWFGDLPISLSAEHGSIFRQPGQEWEALEAFDLSWMEKIRKMLEEVCDEVPGSMIETKQFGIAWHYRMADRDYGLWRSRELLDSLEKRVAHLGVDVLPGNKVIEVRARGIHKGKYARRVIEQTAGEQFVLCLGDDRTDIDMYRALPDHATRIHIGSTCDDAQFTMESPERVRALLSGLAKTSVTTQPAFA